MTSAAITVPHVDYSRLRIPAAAFELIAYLVIVAAASLAFLAGWLSVNGAVVLTVLLLASLIVLSWINLGQGRHPVFLFLCSLTFFQGGRLIGYCLGGERDPLQVIIMTSAAFNLSRAQEGLVLLALALSAVCIYVPCRYLYQAVTPPTDFNVRKYLPYLYLLFAATLPVQIFKNYRYYEYAQQHGGYIFIYVNHAALASSVPFWVRVVPLITLPAFVAIFVFERRRLPLYLATFLYFVSASLTLLLGSRGGPFMLIASLWWAARVKSLRKTRIALLTITVLILLIVGNAIQETRQTGESEGEGYSLVHLIVTQGISLNVTEVAFKYRYLFSPYTWSYLVTELQNAFVANDVVSYQRGKSLAIDISVFLDPEKYRQGHGTASSYIAEAYVAGGMVAIILVSIALGLGLHALYRLSANAVLLFVMTLCLPDVLLMPKGQLLDWVSVLIRNGVGIALLWFGWKLYSLLLSIRRAAPVPSDSGIATA